MTPAAKADLQGVWNYTVELWGEAKAETYIASLKEACESLLEHPKLGVALVQVDKDLRVYRCQHHFIFYLTDGRKVTFIAFLHERMDMLVQLMGRV